MKVCVQREVPISVNQMFDVVANVERYPELLPDWRVARLLSPPGDVVRVGQEIGVGPLRLAFESTARYHRPRSISVRSDRAGFGTLDLDWRFTPLADAGCRVELEATVEWLLPLPKRLTRAFGLDRLTAALDILVAEAQRLHRAGQAGAPEGVP